MAESIRERRARRHKKKEKLKNDDLYNMIGVDSSLTIEEGEIEISTIQEVMTKRKPRALLQADYDYQQMTDIYTKDNVAQQLGNYRQAMEYLAHINIDNNDTVIDRLKDIIYDYPNIDISSFANKHTAKVYSWIIQQMGYTLGEKYLGAIYVLGSGMGLLPAMMLDSKLRFENIRGFDINGTCQFLADALMKDELLADWRFKATTQDLFNIDYAENTFQTMLQNNKLSAPFVEVPSTIINYNVSYLEKPADWYDIIPDMRRVIVVGENGTVPTPFASSQSFNTMFPMNFEIYSGTMTVDDKQYFMKIGFK